VSSSSIAVLRIDAGVFTIPSRSRRAMRKLDWVVVLALRYSVSDTLIADSSNASAQSHPCDWYSVAHAVGCGEAMTPCAPRNGRLPMPTIASSTTPNAWSAGMPTAPETETRGVAVPAHSIGGNGT